MSIEKLAAKREISCLNATVFFYVDVINCQERCSFRSSLTAVKCKPAADFSRGC